MKLVDTDFLVIGSGIAGLLSALHLSKQGRVVVATKREARESNTIYAQGGIACVMTDEDSFETHIQDTLQAGAGLCNEAVVRTIIQSAPPRIAELIELGVAFSERDPEQGSGYDLGKEGGHTKRRVLHAGDITGRELERVLLDHVRRCDRIELLEHTIAIDLITTGWLGHAGENRCVGAYLLNRHSGDIMAVRATQTVLATGGGGKVYLYTSNPDVATGDGLAIALRAGLPIRNMEFIQFHPTCLFHPDAKSFLISEAVRGEGARLVDSRGVSFMEAVDPRGALASRDIVARAIDSEMKATGAPCVYLDIRHRDREFLMQRFPNIYATCQGFGIDMATDLIPVVPAAHYCCGGIEATTRGETALPGLSACGEVACTGLHGANRLASNSLLEAVVCAHALAERIATLGSPTDCSSIDFPDWKLDAAVPSDETIVVEHNWNEVRTCLWDYVGIVRTDKRLARALRRIRNVRQEIREYYLDYLITPDTLELRNIAAVGELIVRSAMQRRESRGLHFTLDCPEMINPPVDTIITGPPGSLASS